MNNASAFSSFHLTLSASEIWGVPKPWLSTVNKLNKMQETTQNQEAPVFSNTVLGTGLLVVGDVHGKVDSYWKILQKHKGRSVQVGDFGFKKQHEWHLKNIDCTQHKINFGNHDDYTYLSHQHSLSNFSISTSGLMTIRGAFSIDKAYRTENVDWWANEELNYEEMQQAIDFYTFNKPSVVISHDCPDYIRRYLFGIREKSITSNGLQSMFEIHQPAVWLFGHHHKSKNEVINGTRFVCLSELETMLL